MSDHETTSADCGSMGRVMSRISAALVWCAPTGLTGPTVREATTRTNPSNVVHPLGVRPGRVFSDRPVLRRVLVVLNVDWRTVSSSIYL